MVLFITINKKNKYIIIKKDNYESFKYLHSYFSIILEYKPYLGSWSAIKGHISNDNVLIKSDTIENIFGFKFMKCPEYLLENLNEI